MKLLDPLSGYRLASGPALLHFSYLIAIWILPNEPNVDEVYKGALTAIFWSHIVNVILGFMIFYFAIEKYFNLMYFCDWLCIIVY